MQVNRIDHGNSGLSDTALVERLVAEQIPLIVRPLSNTRLGVVEYMAKHPLKLMLDKGLCVTINSDAPAYFGGYMNENFAAVTEALNLSRDHLAQLSSNAINAAFIKTARKQQLENELASYVGSVV